MVVEKRSFTAGVRAARVQNQTNKTPVQTKQQTWENSQECRNQERNTIYLSDIPRISEPLSLGTSLVVGDSQHGN